MNNDLTPVEKGWIKKLSSIGPRQGTPSKELSRLLEAKFVAQGYLFRGEEKIPVYRLTLLGLNVANGLGYRIDDVNFEGEVSEGCSPIRKWMVGISVGTP